MTKLALVTMNKLILIFLFLPFYSNAQINKYYSISGSVNTFLVDMQNYRAATNPPPKIAVGGGFAYGFSIREEFNMSLGLDFLSYKPNNSRGYYASCSDDGDIDISCIPIVSTSQLYIPIGFEFYSNANYKPFHSFLILSLIPSFSITERTEMIVYNKYLFEDDRYLENNDGFKFQDFNLAVSICNDFNINEKYKLFIEPSIRLSLLFRNENFVNPNNTVGLKIGIRFRGENVK